MTAWLMAHGPIPSFQKYLLEPARLSSPGLVYGKYAQEAVSLTEKYRGVLRICPWTNSVIWMDLEWSGYISAQRDVSLFFFRCSWVSLIFSSWSKPSEKESMVLSWKSGMTSGWNGAFLHCNRMFNYKPSILGYLRYLHLWKPPPICWNIRPLYSKYLKRAVGLLQRTTSWRKQRVRNSASRLCNLPLPDLSWFV